MLNLIAVTAAGVTDTLTMSIDTTPHVHVEHVPLGNENDIMRLGISGPFDVATDDLIIDFVPACVPADPFYLRWINDLGGFEYHMFDQHKVFTTEAGGIVDFFPSTTATPDMRRTREIIELTDVKRTATVGMEQLDRNEFERLAGIVLSPRIDVYDAALAEWHGVTIDENHKIEWDTRASLGAVELTLRLKSVVLQF